MYSQPSARIRSLGRNPEVTLSFRSDTHGADIVVLSGTAEVDASARAPSRTLPGRARYATDGSAT